MALTTLRSPLRALVVAAFLVATLPCSGAAEDAQALPSEQGTSIWIYSLYKAITYETAATLAARFRAACYEATPARITPPAALRDPDDVHVLACAVTAEADAIVTGDNDLLALESFEGIPIIKAAEALKLLGLT